MSTSTKILIVEDDTMISAAYKLILESVGYQVFTAADGQEGLDQAAKSKPDLIMLDMLMPVMNGIEFLRAYKSKKLPATKIVILSNSSSVEKVHEALDLGAFKYLIKTQVKPEEIKATVKEILAT